MDEVQRMTIRTALARPYQGLLDATKPPSITTQWTPLGRIRTLHVRGYEGTKTVMRAPWASRRITPSWMPTRLFNLILSGPTAQERGPKHDRLRAAAEAIVGPSVIGRHHANIQRLAHQLVNEHKGSTFDLARLAEQLTYEVACDLLGVEDDLRSEEQRLEFFRWLDTFADSTSPFTMPEQKEVKKYYRAYIKSRQQRLQDQPIDALLTSEQLAEHEKIAMAFFTMMSATITTSYAICSAYGLLQTELSTLELENVLWSCRQASGNELVSRIYNEGIRFHGPILARPFRVIERATLAGQSLKPGDYVEICWSSANRDPAKFANPHTFDPYRHPNPHLAFSIGDYACSGRVLSSLVATAFLGELLSLSKPPVVQNAEVAGTFILRMRQMQAAVT